MRPVQCAGVLDAQKSIVLRWTHGHEFTHYQCSRECIKVRIFI